MRISPKTFLKSISYWPPYLASGIQVMDVADDFSSATVSLKTRPWNKNYFGTHFGGSLYSMCDPFYMFLLIQQLGKEYIVWDSAAEIEFLKAVSEPVHATFTVTPAAVEGIREATLREFKVMPEFMAEVITDEGLVAARVRKTLYVRRKDAKQRFS